MILLMIAMDAEMAKLDLSDTKDAGIFILKGSDIIVCKTGIGKVNAAMALEKMIQTTAVTQVYNIGFAGATPPFHLHDVVLVEEASYHDFDLSLFGYAPGQVPGYPKRYQGDKRMIDQITKSIPMIKRGTLLTGDRFMKDTLNEPFLADMEGTALFQVAYHHQIPMASIKIVSDIIGSDDHEDSYLAFEARDGGQSVSDLCKALFLNE
jgi:adenosylhomocysteine nucleosidase